MSTLKVNKLRDTAGSADAITLDPNGGAVLAGVTTISTARITTGITTSIQVGGGVTISESGIEASGIGITCANINGTQIGGRRNLVINGDMRIAQRGTSSTSSNGYYTIDRVWQYNQGTDEAPTFSQVDVSSGTPAYQAGFRKALRITNGNQTSGAGAADQIQWETRFEAQDIANSGWNYTSPTSFLTFSYYIKSSVAQAFNLFVKTEDGTEKGMPLTTPSLTADTWTRVIFRIKGDSGISFDNNNGKGLSINLGPFLGTNYTDNSITDGEWIAWSSSTRTRDQTSTWYTTNDATVEFTGLQLEVGTEATAFEHRSFGEELTLCHRYYQKIDGTQTGTIFGVGNVDGSTQGQILVTLGTPLRTKASSMDTTGSSGDYKFRVRTTSNCDDVPVLHIGGITQQFLEWQANSHGFSDGDAALAISGSSSSFLGFSAEL